MVAFRMGFNLLVESLAVIPAGELTISVHLALSWWKHHAEHLQRSGRDWWCSLSSALNDKRLQGGKVGPVIGAVQGLQICAFCFLADKLHVYGKRVPKNYGARQKCWTTPVGDFWFPYRSPLPPFHVLFMLDDEVCVGKVRSTQELHWRKMKRGKEVNYGASYGSCKGKAAQLLTCDEGEGMLCVQWGLKTCYCDFLMKTTSEIVLMWPNSGRG